MLLPNSDAEPARFARFSRPDTRRTPGRRSGGCPEKKELTLIAAPEPVKNC